MGICASCLALGRRDSRDQGESARLLDDDIYQPGNTYGGVNQGQRNGPDSEDVKREREALDAICQRTSDSVIDVWSAQQPYTSSTVSSTQRPKVPSTSRVPSSDSAITQVLAHSRTGTPTQPPTQDTSNNGRQDQSRRTTPTAHGEFGNLKYVAYPNLQYSPEADTSTAPKHWGEVVMNTKKDKENRSSFEMSNGVSNGDDVFDVLNVK